MPNHEGDYRSLFLGERQELCREIAKDIPIERQVVRDAKAVEDREQQQRVFGRLAERLRLFDQQVCPLHGRLCFRRSKSFDMHERAY
jgi:hypothetical protein